MTKFFSAILVAIAVFAATAAGALIGSDVDMFTDVESSSWAYPAMEALRSHDIVLGYPVGYFSGKRTLTRYEFAVALDRTLRQVDAATPASPGRGASIAQATTRIAPADMIAFRRLAAVFRSELTSLGNSPRDLPAKLDALAAGRWRHSPLPDRPGPDGSAAVQPVPTGSDRGPGTTGTARSAPVPSTKVSLPIPTVGAGTTGVQVGPLSVATPPSGPFAGSPVGNVPGSTLTGARVETSVGAVSLEAIAGKSTVAPSPGGLLAIAPTVGATPLANGFRPAAQAASPQMAVGGVAGVDVGVGFNVLDRSGHLRLSALGLSGGADAASTGAINSLLVLGANGDVKLANRLALTADWSRSIAGVGQTGLPAIDPSDSFNATLGYGIGNLNINAGYRYVDPNYYAPGYWGQIGNWINPTNIQGPTFRAAYALTQRFGLNLGGDFFTAAKDRSLDGGLNSDDEIDRVLLGLHWDVARNFHTTIDWEGVYWSLSGTHAGLYSLGASSSMHPTEQYLSFGTGYNFTRNALIQLNYKMGAWDGRGMVNGSGAGQYNVNTVTGQVTIKF